MARIAVPSDVASSMRNEGLEVKYVIEEDLEGEVDLKLHEITLSENQVII